MIAITIKTLDSRNHEFSFEEDITVKQLKEMIAESVSVPAESQRLIYCGRVLLDDKKLSEFDVNGKVIHLVQRAPPSTSGSSSSNTSSSTSGRNERSGLRSRLDNAMYLGAMAFPADLMEAQGLTVPPPRHTLSHSRLGVARSMLARASAVLHTLEGGQNTNPPQNEEAPSGSSTPSETPNEPSQTTNIQAEVTLPGNSGDLRASDIAAAASAAAEAVTAALDHALSVHHGGNVSITVNNSESSPDDLVVRVTQGRDSNSTPNSTGSGNTGRQRTTALADLVTQLRAVNRRMEPYLDRYYHLMHNDPPDVSDSQEVFNQVSELMHLLGHAYHALSDIMCDLSQPPPRMLRCRPVLIQHSAVLQTGIPIQVPTAQIINLSTHSNFNPENVSQTEGENNQPQARTEENTPETPPRSESRPSLSARRQVDELILHGLRPSEPERSDREQTEPDRSENEPERSEHNGPGLVSISPSNLEIFMDVSSGAFTIDSLERTVFPGSAPSSSNSAPTTASTTSSEQTSNNQGNTNTTSSSNNQNPWSQTRPNTFMQNLLQRVYGEMSNIHNNNYNPNNNNSRNNTTDSTRSQPSSSAGTNNSTSTDRDSEPQREGTGTSSSSQSGPRPVFSSRPHIHIGPSISGNLLGGGVDFFDPFLPCNSHHIRNRRRDNSNPNSNSTQQSEESGPSTSSHPTVQMTILPSGNRASIVQHILPILPREIIRNLQSASSRSGGIMRSSLAQLLESLPGQPYPMGQSVILDFIITAGRYIMLQDIGEISPSMLSWMRQGLRYYLENTLGVDSTCSEPAIQTAVDKINSELTRFFETSFEGLTIREDIDLPASIRNISQTFIPDLIKDIHQGDNVNYMMNVSNHLKYITQGIISVLSYASSTSRTNIDSVIFAFATKLVVGNTDEVRTWLLSEISMRLRRVVRPFDAIRETYKKYLVYVTPGQTNTQPMEIDSLEEGIIGNVLSSPLTDRDTDRESLPHVIIGSEPWHHSLPQDWVPIITRDRERQRRGAAQSPLSDAYLAGMPSKRRKLITDNKPSTSLNKVISDSMSRALGAAGLAPTAAAELIEAASCDTGLRNAYKQQVRTSVESTLRSHPDYHPDKYPNTAKYFNRLR